MAIGDEELNISLDSLDNALAFKGNSSQLFSDAVDEVKRLSSNGREIYKPDFASLRKPESAKTLKTEPDSQFDGPLNNEEAVALKILLDESSALFQHYAIDFETSDKIQEILGLPKDGWQSDAMEGIAKFGSYAGIAAGVRDQIRRNEPPPKELKTWGDRTKKDWWERFAEPLKKDGLVIGRNTVTAVEGVVAEFAERDIPKVPEGAKTPEEIRARIESQKHGAKLAGKLYLETKELASNAF